MKSLHRVEVWETDRRIKNPHWYLTVAIANGRICEVSQQYPTRSHALRAAKARFELTPCECLVLKQHHSVALPRRGQS